MKTFDFEVLVGFSFSGLIILLAYLSLNLGQVKVLGNNGYTVQAGFRKQVDCRVAP